MVTVLKKRPKLRNLKMMLKSQSQRKRKLNLRLKKKRRKKKNLLSLIARLRKQLPLLA